jgi:phage head maturation protease
MADYEDASLEAMNPVELLATAKKLRDRIREGYDYLITNYNNGIKSVETGQFVSFEEFIETGSFREKLLEYLREKISL